MKKMGKVLEKKVTILREGGSVTMSHKLLEDLREVLSPIEYKNLCFVGGGAFIENLKETQQQEKTVEKEETEMKKIELKVHTKAKLIKIIEKYFLNSDFTANAILMSKAWKVYAGQYKDSRMDKVINEYYGYELEKGLESDKTIFFKSNGYIYYINLSHNEDMDKIFGDLDGLLPKVDSFKDRVVKKLQAVGIVTTEKPFTIHQENFESEKDLEVKKEFYVEVSLELKESHARFIVTINNELVNHGEVGYKNMFDNFKYFFDGKEYIGYCPDLENCIEICDKKEISCF